MPALPLAINLRTMLRPELDASSAMQVRVMLAGVVIWGLLYGAVMGCFGGIAGERSLQLLYSGIKFRCCCS